MIPYERIIIERIDGETPKEKHDTIQGMQQLLQKIAFPRRGSIEETWTIYDVAKEAAKYIKQDKEY